MATFGQTGDQASNSTSSADSNIVNKATNANSQCPSNGTLNSVKARIWVSGTGTTKAKGVVYSSAGALLATGDEVTVSNNTEQEITLPFSGGQQISLVSGTSYAYGVHFKDPGAENFTWSRGGTANASWKNSDTYADGPQGTLGSGTVSGPIDMYIDYTPSGGTSITVTPTVLSDTLALLDPTVSGGAIISPSLLATTLSLLAPTISGEAITSATVLATTLSLLDPTVTTVRNVTITPVSTALLAALVDPTILPVQNINVSVSSSLNLSFTQLAATVSTIWNVDVTPSTLSLLFDQGVPTVTGIKNISVTPSVLALLGEVIDLSILVNSVIVQVPTLTLGRNPKIILVDGDLAIQLAGNYYIKL